MRIQLLLANLSRGQIAWLGAICFFLLSACSGLNQSLSSFHEGQILDLRQGTPISFEELKPNLLNADVIYIGEEHYNPSHIQAATQILAALHRAGKQPALAMEMFSWDGQPALIQLGIRTFTKEQFVHDSQWQQNWGGQYENYQLLVDAARNRHIPLYALNPPHFLVRTIAKMGLSEGLTDPAMHSWDLPQHLFPDDPDYYDVIYDQIVQCHPNLPQDVYQRIYEASIFRDAGMAKVIVDYLRSKSDKQAPLVSYTGGGHIQYNIPIPKRVSAQADTPIQQVTIYLMAFDPTRESDIDEALSKPIADYIWLTPLGPEGPQPRCG